MALGKEKEGILKRLIREDGWDVLVEALGEYLQRINEEEITGTNAFESLRALHERQGGAKHLKAFFDEVEKKNI